MLLIFQITAGIILAGLFFTFWRLILIGGIWLLGLAIAIAIVMAAYFYLQSRPYLQDVVAIIFAGFTWLLLFFWLYVEYKKNPSEFFRVPKNDKPILSPEEVGFAKKFIIGCGLITLTMLLIGVVIYFSER